MGARKWPPIPRVVEGLAGSVRVVVRRVESFAAEDGDKCWGLYKPAKREIHIAGKVPIALRWHTLIHEWAHAWMMDSGIHNIVYGADDAEKGRNAELICDSLATALVRSFVQRTGIDPFSP
jgi:hypothetical protein